jgi:hypothetical protein
MLESRLSGVGFWHAPIVSPPKQKPTPFSISDILGLGGAGGGGKPKKEPQNHASGDSSQPTKPAAKKSSSKNKTSAKSGAEEQPLNLTIARPTPQKLAALQPLPPQMQPFSSIYGQFDPLLMNPFSPVMTSVVGKSEADVITTSVVSSSMQAPQLHQQGRVLVTSSNGGGVAGVVAQSKAVSSIPVLGMSDGPGESPPANKPPSKSKKKPASEKPAVTKGEISHGIILYF